MALVERIWYANPGSGGFVVAQGLLPLSCLFEKLASRRRERYRQRARQGLLWTAPVPVIIVGNISVGGTGKTPVVVALVEHLRREGFSPGVVSRGYGGTPPRLPLSLTEHTSALHSGDEPLLVYRRTACPVVVDPDRVRAVRYLLAQHDVDVVVSDDGLQHYRLQRDIEIAVVDAKRGLGNGFCLPAGPLREPPSRLQGVDMVLLNGGNATSAIPQAKRFDLRPREFVNLGSGERLALDQFPRRDAVHAVAGIGNPRRFFDSLRRIGLTVDEHAFADHYRYRPRDIDFGDERAIIMTEKDAVKCSSFASPRDWYLAVEADLPDACVQLLRQKLPLPGN